MKISLQFFEALLARQYGSATIALGAPNKAPSFRTASILAPGIDMSDDTLYIDFLPLGPEQAPRSISVVARAARAELFEGCNVIVLPNSANIFAVPGLLSGSINRVFS